jgi:predicted phosphoribosyltransferase
VIFVDRYDAGQKLAIILEPYRVERPLVLGLPRGGVVVASEVARALDAPLDVLVVRKLGAPGAQEYAIGALAPEATLVNAELVEHFGISHEYLSQVIMRETEEMRRRERVYRSGRPPIDVDGRTVILVDDGLATGATALAAVESLRRHPQRRIIFAAPVCSRDGAAALAATAVAVVCIERPDNLRSVGEWYHDFTPTSDAEVLECLRASEARRVSR